MDAVEKFLRKVDAKLRKRLLQAIALLAVNELKTLDIKPLTGHEDWFRCRVGNVRIIFTKSAGKNIIYEIEFRGSAYKNW